MRPRRSARHRFVVKGAHGTQPAPRQYVFDFNMLTDSFNSKTDFISKKYAIFLYIQQVVNNCTWTGQQLCHDRSITIILSYISL